MSLIAWWPLNDNTNNYGTLGAEIQATASGATFTDGKIGKALYKGSLTLTGEQWKKIIGNTISIAMWIYTRNDGSYSAGTPFFGNGGMTKPNNRKFTMFHYNTKTNLHCSWQNDDSNSTYWSCHYTDFFELNKWVHLCIVQDAATNTVTVYRNGEQYSKSTVNGLSSMNIKEAGAAPIRANINYQHMNDLRIYDHALSQAEVKEISRGLLIHYNFEQHDNLFDVEKYLTSSCVKCTLTPYGTTGFTFTSSGSDPYTNNYSSSLNASAPSVVKFPVVEGQTYCISWRHVEGLEFNKNILSYYNSSNVCVGASAYTGWGMTSVGNWRYKKITIPTGYGITQIGLRVGNASLASGSSITIDNVMMTTYDGDRYEYYNTGKIVDNSGFGYDGTLYNKCYFTSDSGHGTCSLRTYGNTSSVAQSVSSYTITDLGQNITPTAFTISMWAKVNALGVQGSGLFSLDTTDYAGNYMDSTFVHYDWNLRLNSSSGNTQSVISDGIIVLGEWHHYAFTWDGALLAGYRDGELYDKAVAASFTADPFRYIILGFNRAGGVGRDSDVTWGNFKIYMTALGAEDIKVESKARALITDKGDIMCGEFIEDKTQAQVTSKYCFECNELYEEIDPAYERLEYIASTGTQYVDTGYVATSTDYTYELDIAPTKIGGFYSYMGFMANGTTPRAGVHEYSNTFMLGANATTNSSTRPIVNERVILKGHFKSGAQKLYKNDVLIASNSTSFNHSANTLSTHIFGRNYSSGRNLASMKLYSAKIYEGSTLVRHYIPVRRQSDNALGLYDILTDTFCANSGSGTFIGGPALTNKYASIYEDQHISAREIIEI